MSVFSSCHRKVNHLTSKCLLMVCFSGYDLNVAELLNIGAFLSCVRSHFACSLSGCHLNLHVFHYLSHIHHSGWRPAWGPRSYIRQRGQDGWESTCSVTPLFHSHTPFFFSFRSPIISYSHQSFHSGLESLLRPWWWRNNGPVCMGLAFQCGIHNWESFFRNCTWLCLNPALCIFKIVNITKHI